MNNLPWRFLLFWAAFALPATAVAQDLRDEVLKAYRPRAAKIRDAYANISCKSTTTYYDNGGRKYQHMKSVDKYNLHNVAARFESDLFLPDGTVDVARPQVECYNRKYSFQIAEGRNDGKRALTQCLPASARARPMVFKLCAPFADMGLGRSYVDVMEDPSVKFISCEEAQWRGKQVKKLVLEISARHPHTNEMATGQCAFYFLPNWSCCGLGGFDKGKVSDEDVVEYDAADNAGFPAIKSHQIWTIGDSGKLALRIETVITEFKRSPTPFPDSDFTLTAYGFPEPENLARPDQTAEPTPSDVLATPPGEPASWSKWLWGAGAAVVVVLSFAWFIHRRRTAARAAHAKGATP